MCIRDREFLRVLPGASASQQFRGQVRHFVRSFQVLWMAVWIGKRQWHRPGWYRSRAASGSPVMFKVPRSNSCASRGRFLHPPEKFQKGFLGFRVCYGCKYL